ncbi:MAG: adenylate/guanylate cyclase domain-containing protein [Gordonia sp. (in: high G+C Gram-positive bacteria)]|uniref:adenylate/guanylate cyclase domain-containing protein n=1 Tax=Gordonia sp. (in: high G+C Gram-positive bacteria) TaxID=84139 RepID=UPI0039E52F3F
MGIPDEVRLRCTAGASPEVLDDVARRRRLVTLACYDAAAVGFFFGIVGAVGGGPLVVAGVSAAGGVLFALIPLLRRFGPTVVAVAFALTATVVLSILTALLGTDGGLLFYFFVIAVSGPMIVGTERLWQPVLLLAVCTTAVCVLHFTVPHDTGRAPTWLLNGGFVVNAVAAAGLAVYIMTSGMKQIRRAELALEDQYDHSEALLDNILPRSVSQRLKDSPAAEIADTYDDASILFADLAGFTAMSSRHSPGDVVGYLNALYSALDDLTDRYGLEKIKTTGDSYMVVSGVPSPRADHLETLARFALEMRSVCDGVRGPEGESMHLRIGLAAGPVVAGVIGSKKFFYDVWGDAVNLASRMESTGVPDRIQVPAAVRDRLAGVFEFDERGVVPVKGKGDQRTWFLRGPRG